MDPVDQGFVLLAQDQELIFQLQFLLRAAAIQLRRSQTQAETTDDAILLPAWKPALELLKDVAPRKHLFRRW